MVTNRALVVLLFCAIAIAAAEQPPADLAIVNARIFTGVPTAPWAEALVIRGARIVALGSDAEHGAHARAASRVIDAQRGLVIPGINDAHVHPTARPEHIRLEGPPAMLHHPSWDEVLQRVRLAAPKAPRDTWIVGEISAAVLQEPKATRFVLDEITGARPLVLGLAWARDTLQHRGAARPESVRNGTGSEGGFFVRMPDGKRVTGYEAQRRTASS